MISLQSSAQAEALRPDSCVQDQGTRKRERRGERSIKSIVPYRLGHSGQLSTSGGDQGQKGPVAAAGSGPLGSKLAPEYPEWSGCQSQRRVPTRVAICCRKGDPFQGLKLGSCLTVGNELSEETHVLTKQEIFLGKGTRVESSGVREPRRTALPCGPRSWVLWAWDSFPGCP